MSKRTIYIAGPMRGRPRFNYPAFDDARDRLSKAFDVISPADLDREARGAEADPADFTEAMLDEAIARDVAALTSGKVHAIALLEGHEESQGATAERCLAEWLGLDVYTYAPCRDTNTTYTLEEYKSEASPEDVLTEALRLTGGDRMNAYGPPDQDFKRTAAMWSAILSCEVDAKDVALCMIAIKLSRATWMSKRDNWVDIAGYARCGWLCEGGHEV